VCFVDFGSVKRLLSSALTRSTSSSVLSCNTSLKCRLALAFRCRSKSTSRFCLSQRGIIRRSASHLRTPSGVSSFHHSRSDLGMILIYADAFDKPCVRTVDSRNSVPRENCHKRKGTQRERNGRIGSARRAEETRIQRVLLEKRRQKISHC